MAKGTDPPRGGKYDPPKHDNHLRYFEAALDDALSNWNGSGDETVPVTFSALVSPNPGGVKTYIVKVGS
jgi:hypothetical protein